MLAGSGLGSSRDAAWYQRRPSWARRATASSSSAGKAPGRSPPRLSPANRGPEQTALLDGAEAAPGHVIGEHACQEERQVPQPAQHSLAARPGAPPRASRRAGPGPVPRTAAGAGRGGWPPTRSHWRHAQRGAQQFDQEETVPRVGHELSQPWHVEQRCPPAGPRRFRGHKGSQLSSCAVQRTATAKTKNGDTTMTSRLCPAPKRASNTSRSLKKPSMPPRRLRTRLRTGHRRPDRFGLSGTRRPGRGP